MRHGRMLIAVPFLLLVWGCSTPPAPASLQASLLAPCPDLEAVQPADLGDLLEVAADTAIQYRQCAVRHNALVKALAR